MTASPPRADGAARRPIVVVVGLALLATAAFVWIERTANADTARWQAESARAQRLKRDLALEEDARKIDVVVALARRQARADGALHLTLAVDSALLRLERDRAELEVAPITWGPEGWVRLGADSIRARAPRGVHAVEAIEGDSLVRLSGGMRLVRPPITPRTGDAVLAPRVLKAVVPNLAVGTPVYVYDEGPELQELQEGQEET